MSWTKERSDLLEKLRLDGLSATEIAKQLGGVSRCAVLGKAKRLGLSAPGKQTAARPKKEPREPTIKIRPTVSVPEPVQIPFTTEHLCSLFDLTNKTCRYPCWPEGAPFEQQFYCGIPSANLNDGSPYCAEHSMIVRGVSYYAR